MPPKPEPRPVAFYITVTLAHPDPDTDPGAQRCTVTLSAPGAEPVSLTRPFGHPIPVSLDVP